MDGRTRARARAGGAVDIWAEITGAPEQQQQSTVQPVYQRRRQPSLPTPTDSDHQLLPQPFNRSRVSFAAAANTKRVSWNRSLSTSVLGFLFFPFIFVSVFAQQSSNAFSLPLPRWVLMSLIFLLHSEVGQALPLLLAWPISHNKSSPGEGENHLFLKYD
ncbi:hypothetical protein V6N11_045353 [Hibiscus sabdariffa]|uniref:Uncharacterized protein n=1 Tax=Hibiscus sabdariffa TaxID=183260 RepID=A0ABR2Q0P9_9ROSI